MKRFTFILFAFLLTAVLSAETQQQRLAVIPFASENMSKAETNILTRVFEASLVQTGIFEIIEQTQVDDILSAQEYSLSGCTDESCAIEIGKLLAAEQIILGDVSALGTKFIMVARIIDVTSGKNIKADMIEVENMDALSDGASTLAQLLAGVATGFRVDASPEKGSLLIASEPKNAEIFINGVKVGTTPELLEDVPYGKIFLEIQSGNLSASEVVTVSEPFYKISLTLQTGYGDLFIKTDQLDVTLLIDGKSLGKLDPSGYYEDIQSGRHRIELRSENRIWQDEILILKDEVLKIEPQFSDITVEPEDQTLVDASAETKDSAPVSEASLVESSLLLEKTSPGRFVFQGNEYRTKEIVPAIRENLVLPPDMITVLDEYESIKKKSWIGPTLIIVPALLGELILAADPSSEPRSAEMVFFAAGLATWITNGVKAGKRWNILADYINGNY